MRYTLISLFLMLSSVVFAQASKLGIEDLNTEVEDNIILNVDVTTASKTSEQVIDAPGVISVITRAEIENFGANNLLEVIERATGIYTVGNFFLPQNYISIRGDLSAEYNNHVLILINGRPTRENAFGGIDNSIFFGIPMSVVDRIEIIRGPGSVLYGTNAYSGVVNIITESRKSDETTIEMLGGSFGTTGFSASKVRNKDALQTMFGVNFFDQKGWDFSNIGEDIPTPAGTVPGDTLKQKMHQQNIGAFASLKHNSFSLNTMLTYTSQAHHGVAPLGSYPVPTLQFVRHRNVTSLRSFTDLGYGLKIVEDKLNIDFNLTHNFALTTLTTPNGLATVESRDFLFETTAHYNPSERLYMILGGTLYEQEGITETADDLDRGIPAYSELWGSAYFQFAYRFWKNAIRIIGGVQLNKPADIDINFVPRLGLIFRPFKKIGIKALYGQAFRSPFQGEQTIKDLPVIIGSTTLTPEVIATVDAQIFYTSSALQASLTYFNSAESDLISRTSVEVPGVGQVSSFVNQNQLKFNGVEAEVKGTLWKSVLFTGSYSYQENELNGKVKNHTLAPNTLIKTGIFYKLSTKNRLGGSTIGVFNSYFSAAGKAPGASTRNPTADSFNFLTAKLQLNLFNLFNIKGVAQETLVLSTYGVNLLDEKIHYPEYVRRNINTIPGRGGRALYFSLKYSF